MTRRWSGSSPAGAAAGGAFGSGDSERSMPSTMAEAVARTTTTTAATMRSVRDRREGRSLRQVLRRCVAGSDVSGLSAMSAGVVTSPEATAWDRARARPVCRSCRGPPFPRDYLVRPHTVLRPYPHFWMCAHVQVRPERQEDEEHLSGTAERQVGVEDQQSRQHPGDRGEGGPHGTGSRVAGPGEPVPGARGDHEHDEHHHHHEESTGPERPRVTALDVDPFAPGLPARHAAGSADAEEPVVVVLDPRPEVLLKVVQP